MCENIGREIDGKFTLVGVIAGEIVSVDQEFESKFDLFVSIYDIPKHPDFFELRIISPEGKQAQQKFKVGKPETTTPMFLSVEGVPLKSKSPGKFELLGRFGTSGEWHHLTTVSLSFETDEIGS